MSLLLCHECFTWVEPADGRCPQCADAVDAAVPDPAPESLAAVMGRATGCIGEVRVARKMLPEFGMLYACEGGLLFVPHTLDPAARSVVVREGGSSLLWMLASLAFPPLILISPFLKSRRVRAAREESLQPLYVADDAHRPAELLMENPGVFFVPRKDIDRVVPRRSRWVIERREGRRVKLRPAGDAVEFGDRMQELLAREGWRNAA